MSQNFDYRPGHDYGTGVYSIDGSVRGDAVRVTEPEEVTGAGGQKVKFFLEQVETTEALSKSLGASADVSARYGLFSASASFDFAQSISMNQYSIFLLLSVSVTNSFRQMRDVLLTDDAVRLWAGGNAADFNRRYGDGFVNGIATGGMYHAVLQIETVDEREKREISAELEGGYGGLAQSYKASAQFSKTMERVSTNKSIKVRHLQVGGSDSDVEITPETMIEKATSFPETVAGDQAAAFSVMVKSYETLSNVPPRPNRHDLRLAKDVVRECGRLRLRYLDWLNDIDYVLSHPHQFAWTNERRQVKRLESEGDQLREAITGLARQASICADNVSECAMPTGPLTVTLDPAAIPDRKPRRKKRKKKIAGPMQVAHIDAAALKKLQDAQPRRANPSGNSGTRPRGPAAATRRKTAANKKQKMNGRK